MRGDWKLLRNRLQAGGGGGNLSRAAVAVSGAIRPSTGISSALNVAAGTSRRCRSFRLRYLAARTDAEHFASERAREEWEIDNKRDFEISEVRHVFERYGLSGEPLVAVVGSITSNRQHWTDFMMRFELGLEAPDPKRALFSALTIGASYLIGGLIPLAPYFLTRQIHEALQISVAVTGLALVIFGAVKGHFTGISRIKSAAQTLLVGGLAAGAAFWLAHLFG